MSRSAVLSIIALGLVAQLLLASGLAAATLEEGKKAFAAGAFETAVEKLSQLLKSQPDNFEARFLLARSYHSLGKLKESIRQLRLALKASPAPERWKVLLELASALKEDNQYQEAANFYSQALRLRPNLFSRIGLDYAQSLSWSSQLDGAIEVYERLVKLAPGKASLRLELARNLLYKGKFAQAIPYYSELVSASPQSSSLLKELAQALSGDKQFDEAVKIYRRLTELEPKGKDHRLALAQNLSWAGQYAQAVEEYKGLLAQAPQEVQLLKELGRAQLFSGDFPAAAATLAKALGLDPADRSVRFDLARALAGAGRFTEALDWFQKLKEEEPENLEVRRSLADALSANRQFDQAAKEYSEILAKNPQDEEVGLRVARNLNWAGRFKEAAQQYEKIIPKRPEKEVRAEYAQMLLLSGQGERAVDEYGKILAEHPGDRDLALGQARSFSGLKKYKEAIAAYLKLKEQTPEDLAIRRELADTLSADKKFSQAIEEYREILKRQPELREVRLVLARNLSWAGRYAEAVEEYKNLLRQTPEGREILKELGLSLLYMGDYTTALAALQKAHQLDPEDPEVLLDLSSLYYYTGRARLAMKEVEAALKLKPDYEEALKFRALIQESLRPYGDVAPAKILQDNDGNRSVVTSLGFSFFPEAQTRSDFSFVRIDGRSRKLETGSTRLKAALDSRIWDVFALAANLSFVNLERRGDDDQRLLPGLSFQFLPLRNLRIMAGYQKDVQDHTALLIQNDIRTDTLTADINYQLIPTLFFFTRYEYADYSDNNSKQRVSASLRKRLLGGNPRLFLIYAFEFLSFARDLNNGYFDPSNYVAHAGQVEFTGELFKDRFFFDILAFLGKAETRGQVGVKVKFEPIWGATAILQTKVARKLRLEGRFDLFKSATTTEFIPGFREIIFGLNLRYTF